MIIGLIDMELRTYLFFFFLFSFQPKLPIRLGFAVLLRGVDIYTSYIPSLSISFLFICIHGTYEGDDDGGIDITISLSTHH